MPQNETNVWKSAQLYASKLNARLFRNQRYKGKIVRNNKITDAWADCGVGGDGGHDLIGFRSFIIESHHVGKKIAQYFSVETKIKGGFRSDEQKNMARAVKEAGGISGFAESNEDVKKIMDEW